MATFNGSELVNRELAECMRKSAAYFGEHGYDHMCQKLMNFADKLAQPALKCTYSGCNHDAMFRLSSYPTEASSFGRIAYRCELHVLQWVTMAGVYGTVSVDLI